MKSILFPLLLLVTLSAVSQQNKQQADSILFEQAESLFEAKEYDQALAIVNRLIDADHTNASLYDLRGNIYLNKRSADTALANYNTAIRLAPEDPVLYADRGLLFYLSQMPDESIEDYNMAIKYVKNDTVKCALICNRGNARNMKRDFEGAYKDYKMVYDLDSTNMQALSNLGAVLDDLGRQEEAIMYLEKAARISPNEIAVIGNLGFRYIEAGDYKRAIRQFSRVLELSPDDPLAYNNMGYAKYKMNDLKNALKDIQRSIALYPENSYAHRNRALVYLAMKQTDKACEDLHQAVNLGYTPRYGDDVQQLLEKHCIFKDL
jgi:tetratricopeptide (TPR) repeat protein